MTPGREVAGSVDAVGAGVGAAWLGRRVVAHLGAAGGGYAALALGDATALHDIPADLDAAGAVAMIGTGRTAMGVLEVAALTGDDIVLVPAAAGGLGALIVQAAVRAGATVVGLAGGPAKVERVRELGALAVDYRESGWPERVRSALDGRPPSLVLDGVGGQVGRTALELLDVGGRLVVFGASAGSITPFTSGDVAAGGLTVSWAIGPRMVRRGLRALETRALAAAAAGQLVPVVHPAFALADAAGAHRALEGRATTGKVVLVP